MIDNINEIPACISCQISPYNLTPRRSRINSKTIYWHINDYLPSLDQGKQLESIKQSFDAWAEQLNPIKVIKTSDRNKANITLFFASDSDVKDKPPVPFGNSSVLAYAYFPVNNKSQIWFDKSENWSLIGTISGISLLKVSIHEIGHSLGFEHTDARADIMFPTYNVRGIISQDSKDAIEDLYGDIKKSITPTPIPPPPPPPTPTPGGIREYFLNLLKKLFPILGYLYRLKSNQINEIAKYLNVSIEDKSRFEVLREIHKEIHKK